MTTETKPGYKTTEFILTVLYNVAGVIQMAAAPFHIADKWVLLSQAIVTAAYGISRGQAKQGVPYFAPRADGDEDLAALADEVATDVASRPVDPITTSTGTTSTGSVVLSPPKPSPAKPSPARARKKK